MKLKLSFAGLSIFALFLVNSLVYAKDNATYIPKIFSGEQYGFQLPSYIAADANCI